VAWETKRDWGWLMIGAGKWNPPSKFKSRSNLVHSKTDIPVPSRCGLLEDSLYHEI
jgi:hypothetical protein